MDDQNEPGCGDSTDALGDQRGGASPAASWPSGSVAGGGLPSRKVSEMVVDCYKMDHKHRGKAIVINNKTFSPRLKLGVRKGTDKDATNLYDLFTKMGFDTTIEVDCAAQKIKNIMSEAADDSHWDEDCFVCAILSHGEQGAVYATDAKMDLDELITPLKKCPSLAGKPKLFFIQASNGDWKRTDGLCLNG
ncbi:hypothetical protein V1264_010859 [Littorina saxatilis]|uniref:Caspase family p20 domain-containing protein n=1 Tax=Littorina saxatilis TaxID=31220 RepID=A0AAN9BTP8_9CAEN